MRTTCAIRLALAPCRRRQRCAKYSFQAVNDQFVQAVKRLGILSDLSIAPAVIKELLQRKQILITPNGLLFVRKKARPGILPRLLQEILDTRVMIKKVVKREASSGGSKRRLRCLLLHVLWCATIGYRSLDARQLSLKLLANTTYGYTSASFSGRMPCAEIADAIVATARQTLEDAMAMVSAHTDWKAEVVTCVMFG